MLGWLNLPGGGGRNNRIHGSQVDTQFPTASYNRPHIRAGVPLGGANSQPGPSLCPSPKPQALSRFAPSCLAHSRPRKKRLSPPARPGPIRIGPEPHVRLAAGKCIVYSLPWGRRRKSTPHIRLPPLVVPAGGPGASPSPGSVRPGLFATLSPGPIALHRPRLAQPHREMSTLGCSNLPLGACVPLLP
jgi:hypothetical protein